MRALKYYVGVKWVYFLFTKSNEIFHLNSNILRELEQKSLLILEKYNEKLYCVKTELLDINFNDFLFINFEEMLEIYSKYFKIKNYYKNENLEMEMYDYAVNDFTNFLDIQIFMSIYTEHFYNYIKITFKKEDTFLVLEVLNCKYAIFNYWGYSLENIILEFHDANKIIVYKDFNKKLILEDCIHSTSNHLFFLIKSSKEDLYVLKHIIIYPEMRNYYYNHFY